MPVAKKRTRWTAEAGGTGGFWQVEGLRLKSHPACWFAWLLSPFFWFGQKSPDPDERYAESSGWFSSLSDWLRTSVQDIFFTKKTPRGHFTASPMIALGLLAVTLFAAGCQSTPKTTFSTDRPSLHTVRTGHFVINSDVRLDEDNVLVRELEELHDQVYDTLQLPEQRDPVHVYLFSDEASYRFYMHTTWKDLPPRRAYFVGTNRELAVYSFISPQVKEDLRHEFTHGLLHATLQTVPLWLDEGLAEYFEVDAATPGATHAAHLRELRMAEAEKWNPNLYRLEMLTDFRDLTSRDYAESWAWVHFMLNDSEQSARILLDYLTVLQSTKTPRRLMPGLEAAVPSYFNDMQSHIRKMQPTHPITGSAEFSGGD